MQDRAAIGNVRLGRPEDGLHVVAVVDGQDLARVAEHEMGLRAGVLRAVQVGQDLFDIVIVCILHRFGHAGLDLLEALQVRLEGRDGTGRVLHRVPKAREQPVRPGREQAIHRVVQVPRARVVIVVVLQGRQAGRLPGPADHLADESDAPFADGHDIAARAVGHTGRGHDLPRQPRDAARLVIHHPAVDRHGPDGREAVPPVVVGVPVLPFAKVLFRIDEILLVPVRTEYEGSLLVQPDSAVRVVAEVVGEQDRHRPATRDLVEVVRGLAGAGVDQHDALRPFNGIDDAAVLKSVDTFFDSFPVGRHGSEAPWFVSSGGLGHSSRSCSRSSAGGWPV